MCSRANDLCFSLKVQHSEHNSRWEIVLLRHSKEYEYFSYLTFKDIISFLNYILSYFKDIDLKIRGESYNKSKHKSERSLSTVLDLENSNLG